MTNNPKESKLWLNLKSHLQFIKQKLAGIPARPLPKIPDENHTNEVIVKEDENIFSECASSSLSHESPVFVLKTDADRVQGGVMYSDPDARLMEIVSRNMQEE